MEIEIGQREVHQVILALEGGRLAADRKGDLARLRAVDRLGLEAFDIGDGLGDARLEFGQCRLSVLVFQIGMGWLSREMTRGSPCQAALDQV